MPPESSSDAGLRAQLATLDRSLAALLHERARLLADFRDGGPAPRAAVEDLLRRSQGPLSARDLRSVFGAIDAACGAPQPQQGGRADTEPLP